MPFGPLDMAKDVDRAMAGATRAVRDAVKQVGKDAEKVARAKLGPAAKIVPGGDARFSRMAKLNHGGRLGLRFRHDTEGVTVVPRGPWKLAETGADAHTGKAGKDRHPTDHPGTRQGRKSWSTARAEVLRELDRTVPDMVARKVEGGFDDG